MRDLCQGHKRESKTQTATSRIWTWINDSISYKDNRYAKSTSKMFIEIIIICLNFSDETCELLLLRIFELLSSSLLL